MRLVNVDKMTERSWHDLQRILKDFMYSGSRFAKVEFGDREYKDTKSAVGTLRLAIKRSGYRIKVHQRKGEIFLERPEI